MAEEHEQQFALQRIYIRDLSFEMPEGPDMFKLKWQPQMNLDINTRHNALDDDNHEVVLTLTLTAKLDDKTAYLVEVQQAGIFLAKGLGDQLPQVLGALCPSILFPYAREAIDTAVTKASFPAVMLAPINFDAFYARALEQAKEQGNANAEGGDATH